MSLRLGKGGHYRHDEGRAINRDFRLDPSRRAMLF